MNWMGAAGGIPVAAAWGGWIITGKARLAKGGEGGLVNPLCSQSAHAQKVLPRCAQLGINHAALVNLN